MIIQRVQQQDVMEKIAITEAETNAYYDAHKTEFTTPAIGDAARDPHRRAREGARGHAGRRAEPASTSGSTRRPQAKAAAMRARALKGEDFAALVRPRRPTRRRRPTAA